MSLIVEHCLALVQNPVLILFVAITAVIEPPSVPRWIGWSFGPPISFWIVNYFDLLTAETIGFDASHDVTGWTYWVAAVLVTSLWLGIGMILKARYRARKGKTAA